MKLLLDSGSSISLVQRDVLSQAQDIVCVKGTRSVQLVTASGEQLSMCSGGFRGVSEVSIETPFG